MDITQIVQTQHDYFEKANTLSLAFRRNALKKLRDEIRLREKEIFAALEQDLGKQPYESYITEVGLVLEEIGFLLKHFKKWARPKKVKTPLVHFPAKSRIFREPYGVALIMAPWNYPFQLSLLPLAGAIAAGNCAVLKPSAYAPATSALLKQMAENCFAPQHVTVVEGGREENTQLLDQRFDFIFFTGSVEVGKTVMGKAAQHLTPVCLELGGKSPCIVDETADIELAGRRIAFGKYMNAGQTCIAPDYVLVQEKVKHALIASIGKAIKEFFGDDPLHNAELPKIVNRKHFGRLKGLLQNQNIALGGKDDGALRIEPTVLEDTDPQSPVMQQEIFGPVLPVVPYNTLEDAIAFVKSRERPLALYCFTGTPAVWKKLVAECRFGGGCVNDTLMHVASSYLPFGGIGGSGMGSYHGEKSFDTFTHDKSVLIKGKLDITVRYHPYTAAKEKLVHRLLK